MAGALVVASSLLVVACGGEVAEKASLETDALAELEAQLGVEVDGVVCPEETPLEADEEFECDADIAGGETVTVTGQVTDAEGAAIHITGVN
jgi:hypothetical protein